MYRSLTATNVEGVMTMKGYSKLPISSEPEPHHHIQFLSYPRQPFTCLEILNQKYTYYTERRWPYFFSIKLRFIKNFLSSSLSSLSCIDSLFCHLSLSVFALDKSSRLHPVYTSMVWSGYRYHFSGHSHQNNTVV